MALEAGQRKWTFLLAGPVALLHFPAIPRLDDLMQLKVPFLAALLALAGSTALTPLHGQERETYESRTLGPVFQSLLRMVPVEGLIVRDSDGWQAIRVAHLGVRDSVRIEFRADADVEYTVWGWSEEGDIDICVYDPEGARVNCDTFSNARPVVRFTTRGFEEGMYTAVLEAVSDDVKYAGMLIAQVFTSATTVRPRQ